MANDYQEKYNEHDVATWYDDLIEKISINRDYSNESNLAFVEYIPTIKNILEQRKEMVEQLIQHSLFDICSNEISFAKFMSEPTYEQRDKLEKLYNIVMLNYLTGENDYFTNLEEFFKAYDFYEPYYSKLSKTSNLNELGVRLDKIKFGIEQKDEPTLEEFKEEIFDFQLVYIGMLSGDDTDKSRFAKTTYRILQEVVFKNHHL